MTTDPDLATERAADLAARADDPGSLTRQWLARAAHGTLCTLADDPRILGYPFGSIVPYALDAEGRPFVFIARIAAHTKNLTRDPRASLFVHDDTEHGDPQRGWRLTLIGRMRRVDSDDDAGPAGRADLFARYAARVPAAAEYDATHGFDFWRLDVELVRSIAGFGRIAWLEPSVLRPPAAT